MLKSYHTFLFQLRYCSTLNNSKINYLKDCQLLVKLHSYRVLTYPVIQLLDFIKVSSKWKSGICTLVQVDSKAYGEQSIFFSFTHAQKLISFKVIDRFVFNVLECTTRVGLVNFLQRNNTRVVLRSHANVAVFGDNVLRVVKSQL